MNDLIVAMTSSASENIRTKLTKEIELAAKAKNTDRCQLLKSVYVCSVERASYKTNITINNLHIDEATMIDYIQVANVLQRTKN